MELREITTIKWLEQYRHVQNSGVISKIHFTKTECNDRLPERPTDVVAKVNRQDSVYVCRFIYTPRVQLPLMGGGGGLESKIAPPMKLKISSIIKPLPLSVPSSVPVK